MFHTFTDASENLCKVHLHPAGTWKYCCVSIPNLEQISYEYLHPCTTVSECPFHPFHSLDFVFIHICSCHCVTSTLLFISASLPNSFFCPSPPLTPRPPTSFLSYVCADFFRFLSASATCVVAMFMCLYISEHLLFQQGPHGLKCQSQAAARQAQLCSGLVFRLLPVPPLLVL